jgi:hypothetical protein
MSKSRMEEELNVDFDAMDATVLRAALRVCGDAAAAAVEGGLSLGHCMTTAGCEFAAGLTDKNTAEEVQPVAQELIDQQTKMAAGYLTSCRTLSVAITNALRGILYVPPAGTTKQ